MDITQRLVCCFSLLILLVSFIECVDRNNFKTCDQSFCKRHRALEPGVSTYVVLPDTFSVTSSSATAELLDTASSVKFKLDLYALEDATLRMKINELNPLKPRFEVPLGDVLVKEPKPAKLELLQSDGSQIVLKATPLSSSAQDSTYKIIINISPLRIDVIANDEPVIAFNSRGLFKFEYLRTKKPHAEEQKPEVPPDVGEEGEENEAEQPPPADNSEKEEEGMWEESFKGHHDSKPNGPSTIGVDFSFPGYEHVYGIPEHSDSLALKSTKSTDPYRMYNLDVFEFEIGNPMALYGHVPFMIAHNVKRTVGLFYLNTAEMWIDVNSNVADKNMFSKLMGFVRGGSEEIPQIDTHWMVESGIVDVFIMLGPQPADVFRQYAHLTGSTPLPPLFGIAYHQSRWNYNDEGDVAVYVLNSFNPNYTLERRMHSLLVSFTKQAPVGNATLIYMIVNAGFDEHDIPMDVIWLDIEHTDGKRYFTWDSPKFPHPADMLHNVSAKGRKMVTIVDPHIKKDDGYHVYKEAKDLGYYIKTKDGSDFEGWCWPGTSSWPDFFNPEIRKYWASKFALDQYQGSTLDLFTWNDMNEPSVFNGPEVTMFKDNIHHGGWEHRDLHNIYGLYVHQATVEGQLLRDPNQRPFVLSRAFFAGTQRYGAIWTGDNTADWSHLKSSLYMLQSLNLAGITLSGADVGGFFKNPDPELLTRWYQAAAFQPFYRAHAHLDTRRREPWLYEPQYKNAMRSAVRLRYKLLPYWYVQFFRGEQNGGPVMRAMWVEFPKDKTTFTMEDQHFIGSAILVHPVTDAGASGVNMYLPGGPSQVWYDLDTYQMQTGGKSIYVAVDINKIPVMLRGGSIIPTWQRVRRASILSAQDPYTLIIALDSQGKAEGELCHDDFNSFNYRQGQYILRKFSFSDNKLNSVSLKPTSFISKAWIERVVIIGVQKKPTSIELQSGGKKLILGSSFDVQSNALTIRKPGVGIADDFTITLL